MTPDPLVGVLPVDKPRGPTSHDVVARARRALGERRIGHTGTLDPFATGLMLLCVGTATRLAEFLTGMDKEYVATAVLGIATDSGDADGAVVATSEEWRALAEERVAEALTGFQGVLSQIPPSLSAKKVDGIPAHRRVRQGEEVTLEPKEVTVHAMEVLAYHPPELTFRVQCSSGTYIRALARDLGEALGVGAHLTALRRTHVGGFDVADALILPELEDRSAVSRALLSPARAMSHVPRLDVTPDAAVALGHGKRVEAEGMGEEDTVAAVRGGELVAVGAVRQGWFRPRKVFPVIEAQRG